MMNGKDGKDVMLEFWVTLLEVGLRSWEEQDILK